MIPKRNIMILPIKINSIKSSQKSEVQRSEIT